MPKLTQEVGFCALRDCKKLLTGRRTRWCSDKCSKFYYDAWYNNHDWSCARKAARRRDKWKCRKCNSKEKLEVNHIIPLNGKKRINSCLNHLENLMTLCHKCHLLETKQQRLEGLIGKKIKRKKK